MSNSKECQNPAGSVIHFSMAFQPIVDVINRSVLSHEALVRGPNGEDAASVLTQINRNNRNHFDRHVRVYAIESAVQLGMSGLLNINFHPNAIPEPAACIRSTLEACRSNGFATSRVVLEITEGEQVADHDHMRHIFREYRRHGIQTAIDDFGAGYSGLNLLAEFQPDWIKLDMALVRGIHRNPPRRAIVRGILSVCRELNIRVIAEGVETFEEYSCLRNLGIRYIQGFLLARPALETLPEIDFAALTPIDFKALAPLAFESLTPLAYEQIQ